MSDWSDSDNEILQITATHGTQVVTVEQGADAAVDVWDNNEDKINDDPLEHAVKCIPLVYTTRLEEMNAFKQIGNQITSKKIMEMILDESKPLFKQLSHQIKKDSNYESHEASYIQLCSRVEELNIKAKNEARPRYFKKKFKPVKMVLDDFNKNNQSVSSKETEVHSDFFGSDFNTLGNRLEFSSEKLKTLGGQQDNSDNEVAAPKSSVFTLLGNKASDDSGDLSITTVALKHKKSQLAGIYIIDATKGVKSFYKTNMSHCNKLQKAHKCKRTVVLEYCCWVNREKCIKKLIRSGFYKDSISNFLRKPHSCAAGNCICCCVRDPILPKISSNVEFLKQPDNKSLNTVQAHADCLIRKTMRYTPKASNNIFPKPSSEPITYLKCAVIIIKYQGVILQQIKTLGENYEIGNTGDIDMYKNPIVDRSETEEIYCYRQIDDMLGISRIYFGNIVCCWQKRNDILIQLSKKNYFKPSTLSFMKTPHPCKSDNCECCCSQANITLIENITNSNNSLVYNKKRIIIKIPLKDENEIANTNCFPKTITMQQKQCLNVNDTKGNKNNNQPVQAYTILSEIDFTEEETVKTKNACHRKGKSQLKTNTTQRTNRKTNEIKTTKLAPIPMPKPTPIPMPKLKPIPMPKLTPIPTLVPTPIPTPEPGGLVNGVLDKFKDLKLTVNDKGKLTAVINASPEKLSTIEIKVLSDILSHAAAQIDQLGIHPKEFCNRVNSARAANGYLSMSIPQLVGISTVVNQTAMNSSGLGNTEVRYPVRKNVYMLMSTLGGQKNRNIVNSFNTHFGLRGNIRESLKAKSDTPVPKIVEVFTLAGAGSICTDARATPVVSSVAANKSTPGSVTSVPTLPPVPTTPTSCNQRGTFYTGIPVAGLNQPLNLPQPTITGTDGVLRFQTNQPLVAGNFNQNIAFIPGISVVANSPVGPSPLQNPILYEMLAQETGKPPPLAPLSLRPDPKQLRVEPLIIAHSKSQPLGKVKRKRGNANNAKEPTKKKKKQEPPINSDMNDINVDIETSLKTNIIKIRRNDQNMPEDEIVHVQMNNIDPIIIDD